MTQNVFEGWEDWLKEFRRDKEVELNAFNWTGWQETHFWMIRRTILTSFLDKEGVYDLLSKGNCILWK